MPFAALPSAATEPPDELVVAPGAALQVEQSAADERSEFALAGGLLRPLSEALRAPDAGDHWLALIARDAAGNASPLRWIRLRVDGAPPSLELAFDPAPVAAGEREWVPGGATALLTASDAVAGVRAASVGVGDAVSECAAETCEHALPDSGETRVRAWAVDRVGNRSDEQVRVVHADDQPPTGAIALVGARVETNAGLIVGPETRAERTIEDAGAGLAEWVPLLDDAEVAEDRWAGPWPAGPHRLAGRAVDRVGNEAPVGPVSLRVDAAAPVLEWSVEADAEVTTASGQVLRPPVRLSVDARDAQAGLARVEWSADGQAWNELAGAVETRRDSLRLRADDRVGNRTAVEARWTLDAEPPRIELRATAGALAPGAATLRVREDEALELTVEDALAGVATARYAVDGDVWRAAPRLIRFRGTGSRRLRVEAVDRLGNASSAEWNIAVGGGTAR